MASGLFKVTLPKYLQSLPLPSTLAEISKLSVSDLISLVLFFAVLALIVHATVKHVVSLVSRRPPPPVINTRVKKDSPKVVDAVEIEDLAQEKISYCRCWKSSKFPLCDGTHNKHNEETKDNIGPLVLMRMDKS